MAPAGTTVRLAINEQTANTTAALPRRRGSPDRSGTLAVLDAQRDPPEVRIEGTLVRSPQTAQRTPGERMDGTPSRRGGEQGWAEFVVVLLFAAVIGFAFLWALVLHEKQPDTRSASSESASVSTTVPLTPGSLPRPRKYQVDGGVNVRQGPATNTTVITKFEDGAMVTVECRIQGQDVTGPGGSTNQWLRVSLLAGPGYVSALYVDIGDDIEDTSRIGICLP